MAAYLIVDPSNHPDGFDTILDYVEDADSLKQAVVGSAHELIPGEPVDVYRVFSGPRRIQIVETVTRAIEDVDVV
jgi:hypothetical protein